MEFAHWGPDRNDGHLVICMTEAPDAHALTHARHVALAILPVEDDHPYSGPGEHVLVTIHANPGMTVNHDQCTATYACVGCESELLDSLLSWGRGSLQEHAAGTEKASGNVPFHVVNAAEARRVVEDARQRLTPAN